MAIDLNRFNAASEFDGAELDAAIDDQYTYHAWDAHKIADGNAVRDALKAAAKAILLHVPPSADRTVALRKLREARMDANSAITHGGKY